MTVRVSTRGEIQLFGDCPSEDAEVLLQHLLASPDAIVDWTDCDSAHAAVIQLLMTARRPIRGTPRGTSLRTWIAPVMPALAR